MAGIGAFDLPDQRIDEWDDMTISKNTIGFLAAGVQPSKLQESARRVEQLGFAQLWLPEDYFENGGFTAASIALSATETIPVGIGVVSVLTRHPAVIAMEASTLARAFPGRLLVGLGNGLTQSMQDLGLTQASPLRAVRESFTSIRELLLGSTVRGDSGPHRFGVTRLAEAPSTPPPLLVGGLGPKMMQLAGEIADSVILSSLSSPNYIRWAKSHILAGAERAGRGTPPEIIDFAWLCIDDDRDKARQAVLPSVAGALGFIGPGPLTDADGYSGPLGELIADGAEPEVRDRLVLDWLDDLVVAGSPADCERAIGRRLDAGAHRVILCPTPGQQFDEMVELTSAHLAASGT